jgi:hypothetical protein
VDHACPRGADDVELAVAVVQVEPDSADRFGRFAADLGDLKLDAVRNVDPNPVLVAGGSGRPVDSRRVGIETRAVRISMSTSKSIGLKIGSWIVVDMARKIGSRAFRFAIAAHASMGYLKAALSSSMPSSMLSE